VAAYGSPRSLCDEVRAHCAEVAADARWVSIRPDVGIAAGGEEGLDANLHFLQAEPEEIARYVLVMDTINFGSGWFPTLDLPPGQSGTEAMTRRLTEHARAHGGTWSADELGAMAPAGVAEVLGQEPGHELMVLYAAALRQLGNWLEGRSVRERIDDAAGSAACFARSLAVGMPYFHDPGFYKRAQIAANDLVHAGVAEFADIDTLTVFADNLVPHVLRLDGVLAYEPELARRIDRGEPLEGGSRMEVEVRACAVHACELIARTMGVAPRTLDNWLWNRGEGPSYSRRPAHRTLTVHY